MVHQIKAQLNASLDKIDLQTAIENICSKLSATLSMSAALDKSEGFTDASSFYNRLYDRVWIELDRVIQEIINYEKKEEPTE